MKTRYKILTGLGSTFSLFVGFIILNIPQVPCACGKPSDEFYFVYGKNPYELSEKTIVDIVNEKFPIKTSYLSISESTYTNPENICKSHSEDMIKCNYILNKTFLSESGINIQFTFKNKELSYLEVKKYNK